MRRITISALFVFCCQFPLAQAAFITMDALDSGRIVSTTRAGACLFSGGNSISHASGSGSIGYFLGGLCTPGGSVTVSPRAYQIFDLTAVTAPMSSGVVSINIDTLSGSGGTVELYDYTETSAAALSTLAEGILPFASGLDMYTDLGSGNLLGSIDLDSGTFSSGVYDLHLNSFGLQLINGASGLLAFGLSYESNVLDSILYSPGISFVGPTQLRLDVSNAQIPIPSTLWLVALAGVLLRRGHLMGRFCRAHSCATLQ